MLYQKILEIIDPQRLLKMAFSLRPESELLVFKGQRLTRRQVFANLLALSGGLQSLGIRKGDRVAMLLPACPEAIYTSPHAAGTGRERASHSDLALLMALCTNLLFMM